MEDKIQVQAKKKFQVLPFVRIVKLRPMAITVTFVVSVTMMIIRIVRVNLFMNLPAILCILIPLFQTSAALIFKPGKVTKSYNEGKQRKPVPPHQAIMFSSFVYFLLFFHLTKLETEGPVESRASDSRPR
ncbi:MAG: DUF3667 domain-containing protein [Bacteroidales bacterium]|nr:DUF3667 domain-containing protein [Bacteroidales bacterium]